MKREFIDGSLLLQKWCLQILFAIILMDYMEWSEYWFRIRLNVYLWWTWLVGAEMRLRLGSNQARAVVGAETCEYSVELTDERLLFSIGKKWKVTTLHWSAQMFWLLGSFWHELLELFNLNAEPTSTEFHPYHDASLFLAQFISFDFRM